MSFGIGHAMELRLQELAGKWVHTVSSGDMNAYGAMYAPRAMLLVPLSPEPLKTREVIQEYESHLHTAFPEVSLTARQVVTHGDTAVVEWEYSGVNTGPLGTPSGTLPPTQRHMCIHGVSLLRFNTDGLIEEEHRYYDVRTLFQQLGIA